MSLTDLGAKIRFSLGHLSQISLTFLNDILKSFDQNMVLSLLLCILNDSLEKKSRLIMKNQRKFIFFDFLRVQELRLVNFLNIYVYVLERLHPK